MPKKPRKTQKTYFAQRLPNETIAGIHHLAAKWAAEAGTKPKPARVIVRLVSEEVEREKPARGKSPAPTFTKAIPVAAGKLIVGRGASLRQTVRAPLFRPNGKL